MWPSWIIRLYAHANSHLYLRLLSYSRFFLNLHPSHSVVKPVRDELSTAFQYWVTERHPRHVTGRQTNNTKVTPFCWWNVFENVCRMGQWPFWSWFYVSIYFSQRYAWQNNFYIFVASDLDVSNWLLQLLVSSIISLPYLQFWLLSNFDYVEDRIFRQTVGWSATLNVAS